MIHRQIRRGKIKYLAYAWFPPQLYNYDDIATLYNVAKMLGHSNTNMTRHYARILDSSIMRNMQTVAKAMDL